VDANHLSDRIRLNRENVLSSVNDEGLSEILRRYEIMLIEDKIRECKTLSATARAFKMPISTLQSKLNKYGIRIN